MIVSICYEAFVTDALDLQDTIHQANFVKSCLETFNHKVVIIPYISEEQFYYDIQSLKPDLVWNLFETFEGDEGKQHLAAKMLENIRIPYTGSNSKALELSSDKVLLKQILREAKIETPAIYNMGDKAEGKWILKPRKMHGSVGITQNSIIDAEIINENIKKNPEFELFAEKFIDGREFSVSLLEVNGYLKAINIAEMQFIDYKGMHKIITYEAKWEEDSLEFQNSIRTFHFTEEDKIIIEEMMRIAEKAAQILGLAGFARVDFRVDKNSKPWVIDINPNPGLGEDAGFIAACINMGMTKEEAVNNIAVAAFETADSNMLKVKYKLRNRVEKSDPEIIYTLVKNTDFFKPEEIEIAKELVTETIKNPESGYLFHFLEVAGKVRGYACYGKIPGTESSYDLYWIAVEKESQGYGFGTILCEAVENSVKAMNGTHIYIETSGREVYLPTRAFYKKRGYERVAEFPDFYGSGDSKIVYRKIL